MGKADESEKIGKLEFEKSGKIRQNPQNPTKNWGNRAH
jgi:hypothetical protein